MSVFEKLTLVSKAVDGEQPRGLHGDVRLERLKDSRCNFPLNEPARQKAGANPFGDELGDDRHAAAPADMPWLKP